MLCWSLERPLAANQHRVAVIVSHLQPQGISAVPKLFWADNPGRSEVYFVAWFLHGELQSAQAHTFALALEIDAE